VNFLSTNCISDSGSEMFMLCIEVSFALILCRKRHEVAKYAINGPRELEGRMPQSQAFAVPCVKMGNPALIPLLFFKNIDTIPEVSVRREQWPFKGKPALPHLTLAPRRTGHVMVKRPHGPEPAAQQLGQGKGTA
jgi:hypothetical protein